MNRERITARVEGVRLPAVLLACAIGASIFALALLSKVAKPLPDIIAPAQAQVGSTIVALPPIAADAVDAGEHAGSCRAGC